MKKITDKIVVRIDDDCYYGWSDLTIVNLDTGEFTIIKIDQTKVKEVYEKFNVYNYN